MPLHYLIREPKIIKEKNPLLLLLHGYGSNEQDLFSFSGELPEEYYVISVRAPYSLMYDSYAWYAINFDADEKKFSDLNQARDSRELIVEFIDYLSDEYLIDTDNITLIGFSQGAILSYAIALSYPKKIKQIAALSGYLNMDIAREDFSLNADFSQLRVFASHGSADQVIPIEWARKTPDILKALKIEVTYKEYPVGHGVAPQNFFDLYKWLTT